jgi:hypothetical protein
VPWPLAILAVVLGLVAVDRLALWMASRGWIRWRRSERSGGGAMAGVLTEFQQIVEPSVRHVIEDRQERHARVDKDAGQT